MAKTIHERLKKLRRAMKPAPKRAFIAIYAAGGVYTTNIGGAKTILTPEQVAEYRRTHEVFMVEYVVNWGKPTTPAPGVRVVNWED